MSAFNGAFKATFGVLFALLTIVCGIPVVLGTCVMTFGNTSPEHSRPAVVATHPRKLEHVAECNGIQNQAILETCLAEQRRL